MQSSAQEVTMLFKLTAAAKDSWACFIWDITFSKPERNFRMGFRHATFYLAELLRQATFYLEELFRQGTFYLAELFRQATFYLAELFHQIALPLTKCIMNINISSYC